MRGYFFSVVGKGLQRHCTIRRDLAEARPRMKLGEIQMIEVGFKDNVRRAFVKGEVGGFWHFDKSDGSIEVNIMAVHWMTWEVV